MLSIPVILAGTAALLFATGNNFQRRAASAVPPGGSGPVRLMLRLLRSPLWLAGGACATGGMVLQARALPLGGVILVQSVIASTLVFALVIEALSEGRLPPVRQLGGAGLVVAGLVAMVRIGRPEPGVSISSPWLLASAWLVAGAAGGGALLMARSRPGGRLTAVVLGAAGGVCFALDAVFLRDLSEAFGPSDPYRLLAALAGFLLTSGVGNLAVQRGFQLAPLRHVLPAMAVAEPLTALVCGRLYFDEQFGGGWESLVAVAVGLSLMISGVVTCALDPDRRGQEGSGGSGRAGAGAGAGPENENLAVRGSAR